MNLPKTKDTIFIGAIKLTDETGELLYPLVGKTYDKKSKFNEMISNIKKSIKLFETAEEKKYIDFNNKVKVKIVEKETYVFIKISFGNKVQILGETDIKGQGFEAFKEKFTRYNQCIIKLGCKDDIFVIDGITNVKLELLQK